ncbi:MAG: DNA polymerase clamp loader subunit A [Nitrosopumilaceae archaeon]|nr:DNA polymerase clamp loader subunit A [Nitrosopumilaceae archaeon]
MTVKNVFDFVNDIGYNKRYFYNELTKKIYQPFMINRAMSQHPDTIFLASEMNKDACLDKQLQHDFYYYAVKSKKRYGKWAKSSKEDEIIDLLIKEYNINRTHAQQYLDLMSDDERTKLKKKYVIGGSTK